MADQFVRNNILTLFFAEHETMANTLTWALPCTQMVVKETMRIEPVVSIIPGAIPTDLELGDYHLEGNSVVFLSTYNLHHDERWRSQP